MSEKSELQIAIEETFPRDAKGKTNELAQYIETDGLSKITLQIKHSAESTIPYCGLKVQHILCLMSNLLGVQHRTKVVPRIGRVMALIGEAVKTLSNPMPDEPVKKTTPPADPVS